MTHDYENYSNLIHHLAHRYHHITGIETDELVSAANEEFMRCQPDYDPAFNTKFSSYLYIRIQGLFKNMERKKNNEAKRLYGFGLPETTDAVTPERRCLFKEIVQGLSSDAREVVKIVFETPLDLINMIGSLDQPRGVTKRQIEKYMKREGWTFYRIRKIFGEIEKSLKT